MLRSAKTTRSLSRRLAGGQAVMLGGRPAATGDARYKGGDHIGWTDGGSTPTVDGADALSRSNLGDVLHAPLGKDAPTFAPPASGSHHPDDPRRQADGVVALTGAHPDHDRRRRRRDRERHHRPQTDLCSGAAIPRRPGGRDGDRRSGQDDHARPRRCLRPRTTGRGRSHPAELVAGAEPRTVRRCPRSVFARQHDLRGVGAAQGQPAGPRIFSTGEIIYGAKAPSLMLASTDTRTRGHTCAGSRRKAASR